MNGLRALLACGAALAGSALAAEIPLAERRSGADFMAPETRAMQSDDSANPGMLWVLQGERLWNAPAGTSGKSCASCHGEASASMRGVAARYPAMDGASGKPIDLAGRIALCRRDSQGAPEPAREGEELLALSAFVGHQSRGMPVMPPGDAGLASARADGKRLFEARMGQLDLACASCHDDNWDRKLGGSAITQAHPTAYPLYRLEWQALGSLQRRMRNCMVGVRAEPFAFGSAEFIDLEAYLMSRAAGLPIETPGVRP